MTRRRHRQTQVMPADVCLDRSDRPPCAATMDALGRSVLARKLDALVALSPREQALLAELQAAPVRVERGRELVHEGQTGHRAYLLLAGWACSFKLLADGARQVIRFPLPGDWIGLGSALSRASDHSFSALTDVVVSSIDATRMRRLFEELPRLGLAMLWAASQDDSMVVDHLVSIGRRSAIERTAHLFLELHERLQRIGLATDQAFACPLNQYVLADALGLSAIHVNRVLRELRERGLLTLKARSAVIHDMSGLVAMAGYQRQAAADRP
jgi:CRP-like cAMP-binding protein